MDSLRHARRDRANQAERDSQPPGCPKGEGPVRRDLRQREGRWLQRLGLVAGHRTPTTTPDAPPIPDLQAQPRGVVGGESGAAGSEWVQGYQLAQFLDDLLGFSVWNTVVV